MRSAIHNLSIESKKYMILHRNAVTNHEQEKAVLEKQISTLKNGNNSLNEDKYENEKAYHALKIEYQEIKKSYNDL